MRLTVLCLICSAVVSAGQEMTRQEIRDVLAKVVETRGSSGMTAEFRETRRLPMLKEPLVESGMLEFLPPDHFRKEVRGGARSLTVFDGEILWVVFPDAREAERYDTKSHRLLQDSFAALVAVLEMGRLESIFRVEGRKERGAYTLSLIPRRRALRGAVSSAEITIGSDFHLRSVHLKEPDGGSSLLELRNHRPANLPTTRFQFTPPADMRVSSPLGR